ncbi:hypothetical protein ACFXGA_12850 [Actinosynnema sp. NPDC059335]|uniref:hypothetical protein n=1 Tax=Actinosynnema sp. NPDC059335 TaxID=3346804 RepID=UPI0036714D7F
MRGALLGFVTAVAVVVAGVTVPASATEIGEWVGPYDVFEQCEADRKQDTRSSGQVCQPRVFAWFYFANGV